MDPKVIEAAIIASIHLIEFLKQAKANGHLADEQLDANVYATNADTIARMKALLAS